MGNSQGYWCWDVALQGTVLRAESESYRIEGAMPDDEKPPLRVSGPIKGYFIATLALPAEGHPGHFTSRAVLCKTRPHAWPSHALIETAHPDVWPSENEAHRHGFRRVKQLLDEVHS